MKKWIKRAVIGLLTGVVLLILGTCLYHRVRTGKELELLKEAGYYHPVSVGNYCLNVSQFGKVDGKHTIVGLAGLGMGDYPLAARQMTSVLEEENAVVFVDRAGYGLSDDTDEKMTIAYIVEDYRRALKNAGMEGPYILMPHSIGGAYANHWASHYPEEIEAIVFVDGSQLSEDAFAEEPVSEVTMGDRMLAVLAKLGFSRYALREYFYHYPDNYTEEEQELGDALMLMTLDSIAPVSEDALLAENAQTAFKGIVTNEIPKLYICASWGMETEADLVETNRWINRQIEINKIDQEPFPVEFKEEKLRELLQMYEAEREEIIVPYAEKMGNCEIVCLAGDHMIYEQKPKECGKLIKQFIDGLK